MQVEIDVTGDREVITGVSRLRVHLRDELTQALRRGVLRVHHQVVAVELRGGTLQARTANLARAVFWRVEGSAEAIIGRVGVDTARAIYGRIQALGGVIRPKRSSHLAIPLEPARTTNGVARFTAREFMANPQAFGYRGAFVNPRSTALMGRTRDPHAGWQGKGYEAVFALKTQVTIPPRNYLRRGLDHVKRAVVDDVRRAVKAAISRKTG